MHRHRILTRFSLILSILNLVLTAPIAVQKIQELAVAKDVETILKTRYGLEASSDRSTSPRSPPDEMADPPHSPLSDGSTNSWDSYSSSVPLLPMMPESPQSGDIPASLHGSESTHSSSSEPGPSAIQHPDGPQELQPETPPSPPPAGSVSPLASHSPSNSWSSDSEMPYMPISERLREFELVPGRVVTPQPTGSDQTTTETHPPQDQFTPEELAPSHHLTSDGMPPSPSPSIETPPDDRSFFNKDMIKGIEIPVAATILGGAMIIAGIVELKHHNFQR